MLDALQALSLNLVVLAAALACLVGMHAVYWLFTHPVNHFWIQARKLSGAGSFAIAISWAGDA